MSLHEQVEKLGKQVESMAAPIRSLKTAAPAIWVLLTLALAFGGWQTSIEIRAQSADKEIVAHDASIDALEKWKERTDSTRITAGETQALISALKDTLADIDKRQARNEDAFQNMQKQLDRIETRLTNPTGGL